MKTSVSLSAFDAPPGMPALFSGASQEHLNIIKELNYDGVDLFVRDAVGEETKAAIRRLNRNHLGVGVMMPAALAEEGLFLGDRSEEVRREAVRRMAEIIRLASWENGMVSLGLVRGNRSKGESEETFELHFADSCKRLLEIAQPLCVDLLIEPINRYEINTINSVKQGMEYIRKVDLPLFLMVDTFHMNIEDQNLQKSLKEALPLVKHVHFLDSNRLAPSMGHTDMAGLYEILQDGGYQGYLCLEALPFPDAVTCAEQGAKFFAQMSKKRKAGGD